MSLYLKKGVQKIIRRILKSGNGSFSINLPIAWVKKHELKAHTEIMINDSSEGLIISPEIKNEPKEIELEFFGMIPENAYMQILSAYKKGFDIIRIRIRPLLQSNKNLFKLFLDNLHGVSCKVEDGIITLENLEEDEESNSMVKKAFLATIYQCKELNNHEKNKKWLNEVRDLYERIHYYCAYAIRLINKSDCFDFKQVLSQYAICWSLLNLSQIVQKIAEIELMLKLNNRYHNPFYMMADILQDVYDIYYSKRRADEFLLKFKEMQPKINYSTANMPIWEHAIMFEHICKQLVMQIG